MKDWLTKYWIPLSALFMTCLSLYLNLQNWKRQGENLTGLVLNVAVTFVMVGALLIAIVTFLLPQQKASGEAPAVRADRPGHGPDQKGWQTRKPRHFDQH